MSESLDVLTSKIRKLFEDNVKGKKEDVAQYVQQHDGKGGHWLEKQMGVPHNSRNAPDLFGFEMKKHSRCKTTFGDWSPDRRTKLWGSSTAGVFLSSFGSPNIAKAGRLSWSGAVFPRVGPSNYAGQKLVVDSADNIIAMYSYSKDCRPDKNSLVRSHWQSEDLHLCTWLSSDMRTKVEKKFNNNGWFRCIADTDGIYVDIQFGDPFTFATFITLVRSGDIICDCGMHQGNARPYMNWRAHNTIWDRLANGGV